MPKKIVPLSPAQKEVIAALNRKREELGLSDREFVRRHLGFSFSLWNRLRNDKYGADPAAKIAECERALRAITDMQAAQSVSRITGKPKEFHELPNMSAVFNAVNEARLRDDQNRAVFYLAPAGGGKSEVCSQLKLRYGAVVVEAKESWRKSYFAGCADICRALGESGPWRGTRDAEYAMLQALLRKEHILAIDEANYFAPHTCNMIKLILNQTRCTVVVCAIPGLFDEMRKKAWWEAGQMVRRAVAVIRYTKAETENIVPFLACFEFFKIRDNAVPAARVIRDAANSFGMYDLVGRVVEELQDVFDPDDAITIDEVTDAIKVVQAKLAQGR